MKRSLEGVPGIKNWITECLIKANCYILIECRVSWDQWVGS